MSSKDQISWKSSFRREENPEDQFGYSFFATFAIHHQLKLFDMGKGDKKSKRGKIVIGSWGVRRSRKKKKDLMPAKKVSVPKPKKAASEKPEKKLAKEQVVEAPVLQEVQTETPEIVQEVKTESQPEAVVSHADETAEEKKAVKKAPRKKAAEKTEEEGEKPKTVKSRKKTADTPGTEETPAES
jgi:30S ribosomal protein S31